MNTSFHKFEIVVFARFFFFFFSRKTLKVFVKYYSVIRTVPLEERKGAEILSFRS